MPISGTGTSSSHNPGSGLLFTSAFMSFCDGMLHGKRPTLHPFPKAGTEPPRVVVHYGSYIYSESEPMLAAAALLLAMYPDWVPARWPSADPRSLDLLANTPINCLWLERPQWSAAFAAEAAKRGIVTLGVIRREGYPSRPPNRSQRPASRAR